MRPSQARMLRRRRRTFLCAGVLTVLGVIAAQRSDANPPSASAENIAVSFVAPAPGVARLSPLGDGDVIARPVTIDPTKSSVRGDDGRLHRCPPYAEACVDLRARKAWLQRDGETTYGPVIIGQGPDHHPTPRGQFHVLWKSAHYTSQRYGIAMPFAVFFASDGIAFHQGALNEPSHGCVHLTPGAARTFFAALESGDEVYVA